MTDARPRGRPRKDPEQLARWEPPAGWVRVVAWVSPEERRALKEVAARSDTSVAELIRGLAAGLLHGVVSGDEILNSYRKGAAVMEKIPTVFERDDDFKVVNRVKPECAWVLSGEGIGTEKLDGTNVRLTTRSGTVVRLEKRRNPDKKQKAAGIVDGWYVDAVRGAAEDRWIFEAVDQTDTSAWPDGEHSCEALGPSIQGNPLGLERHLCVPFNLEVPRLEPEQRTFDGIRQFLFERDSVFSPGHRPEGIVFHHSDGRRAKIKLKDFARD